MPVGKRKAARKAGPRRDARRPARQLIDPTGKGAGSASGKRKASADAETSAKRGRGGEVKPGLVTKPKVGAMRAELTDLRREIRSGTANPADIEQLASRVYTQLSSADDSKELLRTLALLPTHGAMSDGGRDLAATVLARPGSARMSERILRAMTASTGYRSPLVPLDLMRRCLEKDKERDIEFFDRRGDRLTWSQFSKGLGEDPNDITVSSTDRCLYVTRTH